MNNLSTLSSLTEIVDLRTGRPTQAFLTLWNELAELSLSGLADVLFQGPPVDGQTLRYSGAEKKWKLS